MAPNYCTNCDVRVTQASKALQCNICDRWSHIRCISVSEALYEHLGKLEQQCLPYICGTCRPKLAALRQSSLPHVHKSDHGVSSVPPKVSKSKSPKTTPIKKVRANSCNLDGKCETPVRNGTVNYDCVTVSSSSATPVKKDQESWVTVVKKSPKSRANNKSAVSDNVDSKPEKLLSRDNCLIILKAPESQQETPELRMKDDRMFLQSCITKLFDADEPGLRVIAAYRLGRKREDPVTDPRPLKVVLESKEDRDRVLGRTSRLKGESFYVVRDLSPADRERMKLAVEELKRRRENGESNLKIVDFRVVAAPPKARWRPVLLLPSR